MYQNTFKNNFAMEANTINADETAPFKFCNHLTGESRADCNTLIVVIVLCVCLFLWF